MEKIYVRPKNILVRFSTALISLENYVKQQRVMEALLDEVESLEAILMEDVIIHRADDSGVPELIETTVFPVGDEAEQYVCVTLQVMPSLGYPETSPDFRLLRPRGLDDVRLEAIRAAIVSKLQSSLGCPVVFDLIELVREHLTGSNLPSGQCVICLYGFSDGDEFARTECFHYLHSYCLARHLSALRRNHQEEFEKLPAWQQKDAAPFQAACPVCREPISDESDTLKCAMPPIELANAPDFRLTKELRDLQQRMSNLFLQQKSRGGIIDLEAQTGGVIAIETEADIRRRQQQQRKHRLDEGASAQKEEKTDTVTADIEEENETETEAAAATSTKTKQSANSGSTNFAPIVQQTQRYAIDPTNNNYQHQPHNRRHYRGGGGRRHQHHHHHRDRERDRERHEHHSTVDASNSGSSHGSGSSAGTGSVSSTKHTKAHSTCVAHSR